MAAAEDPFQFLLEEALAEDASIQEPVAAPVAPPPAGHPPDASALFQLFMNATPEQRLAIMEQMTGLSTNAATQPTSAARTVEAKAVAKPKAKPTALTRPAAPLPAQTASPPTSSEHQDIEPRSGLHVKCAEWSEGNWIRSLLNVGEQESDKVRHRGTSPKRVFHAQLGQDQRHPNEMRRRRRRWRENAALGRCGRHCATKRNATDKVRANKPMKTEQRSHKNTIRNRDKKNYIQVRLGDLRENVVTVTLFDDAYDVHWKLPKGTMIAVLDAKVSSAAQVPYSLRDSDQTEDASFPIGQERRPIQEQSGSAQCQPTRPAD